MASIRNAINNTSSSLTITTSGLTVTAGATTLTPIKSTSATGVITITSAGVLGKVDTGALGTLFVGTATSPKWLAASTAGFVLKTNGAGADPAWVSTGGLTGNTQYAVVVGNSTGGINTIAAVGATNTVLMGNTGGNPYFTSAPTFAGNVTCGDGSYSGVQCNGRFEFGSVTSSTAGFISINGDRVLHAYKGINNTFLGINSGNFSLTGDYVTMIGASCGLALTSGGSNTGVGSQCLKACTSGGGNTACGYNSLKALTTTNGNSAFGESSLASLVTGVNNTCLGYTSGSSYTGSESNNILIGSSVPGTVGESNVCRIGLSTGTGTGQLNAAYIAGITGIEVTGAAVYVSTSDQLGVLASSERFKENIVDMGDDSNALHDLRPVTFNYKSDEDKKTQYGLIAEEVAKIYPELTHYDKDGKPFSVAYHVLPAMLLNEIQKLNKRIEELEALIG